MEWSTENFIIFSKINEKQILIVLNNSHKKFEDKVYEFSIIYCHVDGKPPSPEYGIKLHLINPEGIALKPLQMKLHPNYLKNPNYDIEKGVIFTYKVNLNKLYEEEGLWHYFFTLQNEIIKDEVIFIPECGDILGPEIISNCTACFSWFSVSSIPNEKFIPAGIKNDDFHFIVSIDYWKKLKELFLCLIPAKKTLGEGISNTMGIRKFPMIFCKPEPNFIGPIELQCVVNFDNLGYKDSELGWFHHYYEAILKDGTKTHLYRDKVFYDEEDEGSIDLCTNVIWADLKQPYVAKNNPQLIDYTFMNYKNSIFSENFFNRNNVEPFKKTIIKEYKIKTNCILNFDVLYSDPSGNEPLESYPRLIFRNMQREQEIEYIMVSNNNIGLLTQYYGEIFHSYICNVNTTNLSNGTWQFYFESKDFAGNKIKNLIGKELIIRI